MKFVNKAPCKDRSKPFHEHITGQLVLDKADKNTVMVWTENDEKVLWNVIQLYVVRKDFYIYIYILPMITGG